MFIASRIEASGEEPGLQSVATAIGTRAARRRRDRRELGLAEGVEGAGEEDGGGAGGGHRRDAGGVEEFEVVGGEAAEFGGEAGAAEVRELLGVDLDREAEGAARPRRRGGPGRG